MGNRFKLLIFDWEGTLADHAIAHLSPLFPDVYPILARLRAQGYLLAIATGKSKAGLQASLSDTHLSHLISATCTAEESAPKPDPLMLFNILEKLAIAQADALMIGDTVYDIEMAHAAKVDALAVTYGLHEKSQLMRAAPQGFIDNILELPQWLLEKEFKHE
jgi:phosphoglycolate phosphatase